MSAESLIVMFIALAAGSLVKGISGIGLPLVAIPVMAGFMPVDHAVAIMVIPGVFINMYLIWTYRKHAVRIPNLPIVAAVAVGCVVLGAWILSAVPGWYITLFIALWLGAYLLKLLIKGRGAAHGGEGGFGRHAPLFVVAAAGLVQGASGVSGPILAPFVHSLKLKQPQYVFAISVLFQIFAFTQLTSFLWLGLIDQERALQSVMAFVPIMIFLPLAVWLSRFFSDRAFNIIVVVLLLAIESRLIWRLIG